MLGSRFGRRWTLIGALLVLGAGTNGCEVNSLEPEIETMMLHFPGNDTVFVDITNGMITSGPIAIFSDADFFAEFFANDGTPDGRVTEARFRLDVTPNNTSLVTFSRTTGFSGTLHKVATGNTQIRFALHALETDTDMFVSFIDIEIN